MMIGSELVHRRLAEVAVRLLRTRAGRLDIEDVAMRRKLRAGHRAICASLCAAVRCADWRKAFMLFGNDSDAGFRFLEVALPFMSPIDAAIYLTDAWTNGQFGEHAFRDGARRLYGVELARRTVALFRQCPSLRPSNLAEELVLHRGVRCDSASTARYAARAVSWTRRRDIAAWFALRYGGGDRANAWLLTAAVSPADVLAQFDDREEAEVIIDPFGHIKVSDPRPYGKTDLGFASDAGYSQPARARSRAAYKGGRS